MLARQNAVLMDDATSLADGRLHVSSHEKLITRPEDDLVTVSDMLLQNATLAFECRNEHI